MQRTCTLLHLGVNHIFVFLQVATAGRKFSTYPAFITNAPATEVSKTSNGIRVASEVFYDLNIQTQVFS
jgi:hypothetical protein